MKAMQPAIDNLVASVQAVDKRMEEVDKRMEAVDKRMEAVEAAVGVAERRDVGPGVAPGTLSPPKTVLVEARRVGTRKTS